MDTIKRTLRRILDHRDRYLPPPRLLLNDAINFDKEVIFIAIPKTGTTTVSKQLKQNGKKFINYHHLDILQIRDSIYSYLLHQSLGNNYTFPTKSVPSDADIRLKANDIFTRFFKFSAVRNPWARAVSLYYRREGVRVSDDMSFTEFCKNHIYASDTCRHPTLHKNQLDWLRDENGKCIMDYVYKLENFSDAIKEISDRTNGRIQLLHKKENYNPGSLSSSYRDLYTEETKKIIAKRFEEDIDYFKYTF